MINAPSSNGKTADFESANRGSSPRGASDIMREALELIADVWALPVVTHPTGRKWHCQHQELLFAAAKLAQDTLARIETRSAETRS